MNTGWCKINSPVYHHPVVVWTLGTEELLPNTKKSRDTVPLFEDTKD
jgi:hypothetical protein